MKQRNFRHNVPLEARSEAAAAAAAASRPNSSSVAARCRLIAMYPMMRLYRLRTAVENQATAVTKKISHKQR
jgi:hypothetical protein